MKSVASSKVTHSQGLVILEKKIVMQGTEIRDREKLGIVKDRRGRQGGRLWM